MPQQVLILLSGPGPPSSSVLSARFAGPARRFGLSAVQAECQADPTAQAAGGTVRSVACFFAYHQP